MKLWQGNFLHWCLTNKSSAGFDSFSSNDLESQLTLCSFAMAFNTLDFICTSGATVDSFSTTWNV